MSDVPHPPALARIDGAAPHPEDAAEIHPLSFGQERLWLLDRAQPDATFNMAAAYTLTGPLDEAALRHALAEVVRRQASLRTTVEPAGPSPCALERNPSPVPGEGGGRGDGEACEDPRESDVAWPVGSPQQHRHSTSPGTGEVASLSEPERARAGGLAWQVGSAPEAHAVVHSPYHPTLPVLDFTERPDDARAWMLADAARPFEPPHEAEAHSRTFALSHSRRLFRATLLRLGAEEHVLVVVFHNLVSDGWSTWVLFRELAAVYGAFARNEPSPLPEIEVQYAEYAARQRRRFSGDALAAELAWWRGTLAGARTLRFPADRPRPAVPDFHAPLFSITVPRATADALWGLARAEGVSLYTVLLAAFQVLAGHWAGETDVVVGGAAANRDRPEAQGLIGFFLNTLPLRIRFGDDPTFRALLPRVLAATLDAAAHGELPFERLAAELSPDDQVDAPVCSTCFILHNAPWPREEAAGVAMKTELLETGMSRFDLIFSTRQTEEGLVVRVQYRADLFDEPTARAIAGDYARLLEDVVRTPDLRVSALPLPHAAARRAQIPSPAAPAPTPDAPPFPPRVTSEASPSLPRAFSGEGPARSARERARAGDFPLSFGQERLWLAEQLDPGTGAWNVVFPVRLRGALEVDALRAALAECVRRHPALRTTFPEVEGRPVQRIAATGELPLPVEELGGTGDEQQGTGDRGQGTAGPIVPEGEREAALHRRVAELGGRPYALAEGPLTRVTLLRLAPDEHVLVMAMHHIVSDGWSTGVFFRELGTLYGAFVRGEPSPLPEPAYDYADHAVWQRERMTDAALAKPLAWWRRTLAGAPAVLPLPADRPGLPAAGARAMHRLRIPDAPLEAVRAVAQREGGTPFMALLAAFGALLGRWAGVDDLVIGVPNAGRARRETAGVVGFFINSLPIRLDLSGDPSFRQLVARARDAALGVFEHADTPFEKIVEAVRPARAPGQNPLFQVMISPQTATPLPFPGLTAERVPNDVSYSALPLVLVVNEDPDGTRAAVQYASDLFDAATAARLGERLVRLLESAGAAPDLPLSALDLLTKDDKREVEAASRPASPSTPVNTTLHARFREQAARTPDADALTFGGASITYAELLARSDALARRLRMRGVGPETRVGLCVERSPETVVGLLGILAAGGGYVPLDPAYPAERLDWLLEDSGAPVVVTTSALASRVAGEGRILVLLDEAEESAGDVTASTASVRPDNLAYVIYTSGSTGKPKGVEVTHANVLRLFQSTEALFDFGGEDVWTLFHSHAFDFSVWEMWGALLYGGRLVIVPWEVSRSPEDFHALLRHERVTVLSQTPGAFRQLIAADEAAPEGGDLALRLVVFGGEALDPSALRGWIERHGDARPRLVNMYGITETTVHVTWRDITRADAFGPAASPIGIPLPDLSVRLLDARGLPVPPGFAGEMVVGGAGVARGYLGRPALTAERFVPDPAVAGGRAYRSGDLARAREVRECESAKVREWNGQDSSPRLDADDVILRPVTPTPTSETPRVRTTRDDSVGIRTTPNHVILRPVTPESRHEPDPAGRRIYSQSEQTSVGSAPSAAAPGPTLALLHSRALALEYLGRADRQVKVRGFRIEPGEIEAALRRHPSLADAAVVARDEDGGERRLVAYVVPRAGAEAPSTAELRALVAAALPEHMVPAAFVALPALPLTAHGKLDRAALPAPDGAADTGEAYAPPRTPAEAALAEVWREVLGVERVGIDDDYFALGGDSMRAVRVVSGARARGVPLSIPRLFQAQTIRALSDELGRADAPAASPSTGESASTAPFSLVTPEVRAALPPGVEDAYPLARLQLAMLYHSDTRLASRRYRDSFTWSVRAPWSEDALRRAVRLASRRHAVLRTAFDAGAEPEPLQLVYAGAELPLAVTDLRRLGEEEQRRAMEAWAGADTGRPFDWTVAPLARLHAHRVEDGRFLFSMTAHHAILDGWSVATLLTEIFRTYAAGVRGGPEPPYDAPRPAYRDFVALERAAIASPETRAFWARALEGAEPTRVPRSPGARRPAGQRGAASIPTVLGDEESAALRRAAEAAGVPLKSLLLAVHLRVLALLSGRGEVLTGLVANGRPEDEGGDRILGLFLNTLPLRVAVEEGSWIDLARAAFHAEQRALPHRRFPYAEAQRLAGKARLLDTLFNYVHFHVYQALADAPGVEVRAERYEQETEMALATSFVIDVHTGRVRLHVEYDSSVLSPADAATIADAYHRALAAVAADPRAPHHLTLGELSGSSAPGLESDGWEPDGLETRRWNGTKSAFADSDTADASARRAGAYATHDPPRTAVERLLARMWGELLDVPSISRGDDFFELGGHSLVATQVISRVRRTLGVRLAVADLLDAPTLAGLATRIDFAISRRSGAEPGEPGSEDEDPGVRAPADVSTQGARDAESTAPTPESTPAPPSDADLLADLKRRGAAVFPQSFAQQRLWFMDQMAPGLPIYNVPVAFTLAGALDVDALRRALDEIVRRHEALRTVLLSVEGLPVQAVLPHTAVSLPLDDLSRVPAPARADEARRLRDEHARQPFDLARVPLFRARLLRLDEREHVLLLVMHHVVADGWSLGVLHRELAALYPAFAAGRPSPLPELAIQYADFSAWQRERMRGDVLESLLAYWRPVLAGTPAALALPTDRPAPEEPTFAGGVHALSVPEETAAGLRALARRENVTLFMVLAAAVGALLSRWSGDDDVVIGTPVANRALPEVEPLIGFFVNTLPLRADLSGDPGFRALVARVRDAALGAFAHQDVPLEKLVEELAPGRDAGNTPLFRVVFVLQNAPRPPLELGGLEMGMEMLETGTAHFDLTFSLTERGEGLAGGIEFSTELFDAETIRGIHEDLVRLLAAIAADPDLRLSALPLPFVDTHRRRVGGMMEGDAHAVYEAEEPRAPRTTAEPTAALPGDPTVAFLFPGLGDQYVGMARGLYRAEPVFRETVDECAAILRPLLALDLRELLWPMDAPASLTDGTPATNGRGRLDLRMMLGRTPASPDPHAERLNRTQIAHPAVFVVTCALAKLWESRGIVPSAVLGHSLGEYAAACHAGVLSLEDALALVAGRAKLIDALPRGAMLALSLSEAEARTFLVPDAWIATVNSPETCVVAGEEDAVEEVRRRVTSAGFAARRLPTTHAFHTPMMVPAADALAEMAARMRLSPPRIPLVSNLTGTWMTAEEATDPRYWSRHLCEPVRFDAGVETLLSGSPRILVEVGPGQTLGTFVRQRGGQTPIVSSLRHAYEEADDATLFAAQLDRLQSLLTTGVILRPGPAAPASAQPSAGPKNLPADAAGPGRGSATSAAGAAHVPEGFRSVLPPGLRITPAAGPIPAEAEEDDWAEVHAATVEASGASVERIAAFFRARGFQVSVGDDEDGLHRVSALRPAEQAPVPAVAPEVDSLPPGDVLAGVAALWQELLGTAPAPGDDFFLLGGHSLLATQLLSRVRDRFGVELSLIAVFRARTLAAFASLVEEAMGFDEAGAITEAEVLALL